MILGLGLNWVLVVGVGSRYESGFGINLGMSVGVGASVRCGPRCELLL